MQVNGAPMLPAGGAIYKFLQILVRGLLRVLGGASLRGLAHLPPRGPFIIAANHPSEIDAIVLGAVLPFRPTFLASRHLEQYPLLFWLARQFDPVFLRRGLSDIGAIRACLQRLERSEVLVVFPEGRVVQDTMLGPLHGGAAFLAIRSGAPIVPVAITGAAAMWPLGARWPRRARIDVRIGRALSPGQGNRADAGTVTAEIDSALRGLIGREEVRTP